MLKKCFDFSIFHVFSITMVQGPYSTLCILMILTNLVSIIQIAELGFRIICDVQLCSI